MNVKFDGNQVIMTRQDFMELIGGKMPVEISQEKEPKSIEEVVTKYLLRKGLKRGIKGFDFARTAIIYLLSSREEKPMTGINGLYSFVAEQHDSTQSRVERSIRHSIENVYKVNKPTNTEFIYSAVDDLRLQNLCKE